MSAAARARVRLAYWWRHGRWPNLDQPRRFTEWVQWRKLNDRDGGLARLTDKSIGKTIAAEILGQSFVIPTLWRGTELPDQPSAPLPLIVKANHGCNQFLVIETLDDWRRARVIAMRWLDQPYGQWLDEWHYGTARREIIVEPFVGEPGELPLDYRSANHRWSQWSRDWQPMPRRTRLGYIAQEAPSGTATPFETVLAADAERATLMAEADHCIDPHRLGDLHERLLAIDAWGAPARAARILLGLGFDEAMQAEPLDSYSGGWKMRVALAALLFSEPDVLLLDEPSNHLDLEATLWLENFLQSYRGTLVVISHERDLLNNVVDTILHLEGGNITLYTGGYDSFERQRAERAAQIAAAQASQDAQRARLQDYIARNSARASTAKQAQSRAKMLAKMQPIAALADDPSLSFDFPSPTELKPPLITLDMASVGYAADTPVLQKLNLRIDPDDRIALLGRNGNGKTTLARLLAAQLTPMAGEVHASGKMRVGYFTQYQVEELHGDDTPLQHMTRAMTGKTPGAVRAQLGRFGFSGDKATTLVGKLSGGERARLALALITRDAPHLLILDEPTNHLDVDSREALVQALNGYDGAVILVSHDRHMVELTADRLVLVEHGGATEYAGSIDDYIDFVLGRNQSRTDAKAKQPKGDRKAAARARDEAKALKKAAADAEAASARLAAQCSALDQAMFDPAAAAPDLVTLPMSELSRRRAALAAELEAAEARWLEASERLERAA